MTMGDLVRQRYPRLIRAVQRGNRLSEPEAVNALVEYVIFGITDDTVSEATAPLGGPLAAIRQGFRYRHCLSNQR
jgi:hypothetical protein